MFSCVVKTRVAFCLSCFSQLLLQFDIQDLFVFEFIFVQNRRTVRTYIIRQGTLTSQ